MDDFSELNKALTLSSPSPAKFRVKVLPSTTGGRGLFATDDIQAGEDIICKKQMVMVATYNHLQNICDNCFMFIASDNGPHGRIRAAGDRKDSMQKCSGCKVVWYCSKPSPCQAKAWHHHHKAECKIFAQLEKPGDILRATIRLLTNQRAGKIDDSEWSAFMSLESHVEEYVQKDDTLKKAVAETTAWKNWTESIEVFKETYCRVKLNCIGIFSLQYEYLGIGLDPLHSLINHSCTPNAHCFFEGPEIRIQSLASIAAGDEINISYINSDLERDSRQHTLKLQWFFECHCRKCSSSNTKDVARVPEGYTLKALQELNHILSSFDIRDPESTESAISKTITTGKEWPPYVQPLPMLNFELAIGYRSKQAYIKELGYRLLLSFVSDPVVYPSPFHPTRVNNLFRLTMTLYNLAKDESKDSSVLPFQDFGLGLVYKYCMVKTFKAAMVSHGKESMLWKALNERLIKEAAMVGDPRTVLAVMMSDGFQEAQESHLEKLLVWAGIEASHAGALK